MIPENKPLIDLHQLVQDASEYLEIAKAESVTAPGLQRVEYTDKVVTLGTGIGKRVGRVNYVNRRLFNSGGYKWGIATTRGYCMEPMFQEGDIEIIAFDVPVEEGDVIAIEKDGIQTGGWYHTDGEDAWIEQSHGILPLEGCHIIGVTVVNARFARLPFYEIDLPAPQCKNCPILMLLLDEIAVLSEGKNPNFPHPRGK